MFVIVQFPVVLAQNGGVMGPSVILLVATLFIAWAMVSAIHVSRYLCLRSLQRSGGWELAPVAAATRKRIYRNLLCLLAVCVGADLLCNSIVTSAYERHRRHEHERAAAARLQENKRTN